jgi:hypothetical protein
MSNKPRQPGKENVGTHAEAASSTAAAGTGAAQAHTSAHATGNAHRDTPVSRYAHPHFDPSPVATRAAATPVAGNAWHKEQLGPIPPPERAEGLKLADIVGEAGVAEIEKIGELRFHSVGDSGVGHAEDAESVADEMAGDFKAGADALNPAFLLHLGDVVYGPDKGDHYGERFYRPYRKYPGKILAIPGNHDGEAKTAADQPSLSAFRANFCAATPAVPAQAAGSGIYRETMNLPGVYWWLDAPFVRIIALYSNRLEDQGFLEGRSDGVVDDRQVTWLQTTLKQIAALQDKDKKALVIATHHPPYSMAGHPSSPEMAQTIDDACKAAKLWPDVFLSGHAHNYQLHVRRVGDSRIPYFVAGTGGMPPQRVSPATGRPTDGTNEVTYEKAVASLGYLFVTASARQLKVEFWEHGDEHTNPFNVVTIDLAAHTLASV